RAGRLEQARCHAELAQQRPARGGNELTAHLAARKRGFLHHADLHPGARHDQRGGRARGASTDDEDVEAHWRRATKQWLKSPRAPSGRASHENTSSRTGSAFQPRAPNWSTARGSTRAWRSSSVNLPPCAGGSARASRAANPPSPAPISASVPIGTVPRSSRATM